MEGLKRAAAVLALILFASCGAEKVAPPPSPPGQALFPVPYFPSKDKQIQGHTLVELAAGWAAATEYTVSRLTDRQKAWVATLGPAGGEGRVGLGFTEDFDGDGKNETVSYGAYVKDTGAQGNFVLVTREEGDRPEILLLKELPGPPEFTVFTLKPDGSLWFGGGIDAGEVTMRITWDNHQPVFSFLTD